MSESDRAGFTGDKTVVSSTTSCLHHAEINLLEEPSYGQSESASDQVVNW